MEAKELASTDPAPSQEPPAQTEQPALGRRIALELRPAQTVTWLGPAWATLCGGLASGALTLSGETLLRFAIAIILTDPILGAWRAAWVHTDWRAPLSVWKPTPTRSWMLLPYARLNSPAARLSQWLSSRGKFWDSAVMPQVGGAISAMAVSGMIGLTVALVLGTPAFFITMLALAAAPLEAELGSQGAGKWARALGEISFAWLIGHAAFTTPTIESVVLALLFAFAYRGFLSLVPQGFPKAISEGRNPSTLSREIGFAIANVSQIVIAVFLVARGAMLNAGFVGMGLIAQTLWQAAARQVEGNDANYLPRVQWFMLATMLTAALGVPH